MKLSSFVIILGLMAFTFPQKKKITVYLIGDSTMANKEVKAFPETGWGMPFAYFFDSSIVVDNRAKNGRSTRTFITENLWQPVADALHPGDYVFIQFGHNDESKEKVDRYTSPEDYKKNLVKFVTETWDKKAIPILLTPVARRRFDTAGNVLESHEVYAPLVREVAKQYNVPLIDLDEKSKALLQQFGKENSKWLFMQLDKNENPNYPEGRNDNTHFNELGARKMAEIVLTEIKNLNLDLENHIRPPLPVKK
jgi:lysophospholipase L1-like esterase